MKNCLALRHVRFENAGLLQPILQQRGSPLRYLEAGVDEIDRAAIVEADLLVVLGGPIGVYEEETYPFLAAEAAAVKARLTQNRPTLGICLGAQLMAKALGATVAPGPAKEIGWAPLELTEAGQASPLRHIEKLHVLHWHGDNFALPPACSNLARTASCPHQAFSRGENLLGLQFHLEADPREIEAWLIGHAVELAAAGRDPRVIRSDTSRYGRELEAAATRALTEWLDNLSL